MKAQTGTEYIFMVAGAILFVVIVLMIIRSTVVDTAVHDTGNKTDTFLNYTSMCNSTIPENETVACVGGGLKNRTCVSPGLWTPWSSCSS